jgi:hypothetical protein
MVTAIGCAVETLVGFGDTVTLGVSVIEFTVRE